MFNGSTALLYSLISEGQKGPQNVFGCAGEHTSFKQKTGIIDGCIKNREEGNE